MSGYDHIQIQTTQNVKLQYEIASISDRIFAFLIDLFIVAGLSLVIILIYSTVFDLDSSSSLIDILAILFTLLPPMFYHVLLEIFNNGQSFGKKIMKIKVIRLDGTEPSLGNFIIRWLTRIIEISGIGYGLALVFILINGKGQRLGDMAAGTAVAKVKQRVTLNDTILSFVAEGYEPKYPQAASLSARDIETIKEAIYYYRTFSHYNALNACGMKIKSLMGLDPYQDLTEHREFLVSIINDYTYYKSKEEL